MKRQLLLGIVFSCYLSLFSEPPELSQDSLLKTELSQDKNVQALFWLSLAELHRAEGDRSCIVRDYFTCSIVDQSNSWQNIIYQHDGLTVVHRGAVVGSFQYYQEKAAIDYLKRFEEQCRTKK